MTPENTPEDGALNDELRFMRKVLAVAETFHELSPDKQQEEALAELEQECPNPYVRSVLTGLRNYQRMGQLDNFRAYLRSDVQREEKKMMSRVDRETAHQLNPLISSDPLSEDTRSSVAEVLRFLSDAVTTWEAEGAEKPTPEWIGRITDQLDMLAAALDYEAAQSRSRKKRKRLSRG